MIKLRAEQVIIFSYYNKIGDFYSVVKSKWSDEIWAQFHHRSTRSFCAGRLTLVKYKPKKKVQKSYVKAARRTLVTLTPGVIFTLSN